MPTLVSMPPQEDHLIAFAEQLRKEAPEWRIEIAETDDDARRLLPNADAVFGWIPPELLPLAQNVKWMQARAAAPPAGYYYDELIAHSMTVTNMRGIYDDHISQMIMTYVLMLARGMTDYMEAQREHRWDPDARRHDYVDLSQATALIHGVGGIGHETARICNEFSMRVIGVDQRWEYETPDVERHEAEELDDLLHEADFVIVTVPHTPETEGMWNRHRFARMKPSAFFINIGRGMTTRLDDLVLALETDEIAGCGLDVFEEEPLPADHKLWSMPNVILTPHIAVHEMPNIRERQYAVLLENAQRFAAGEPLMNVVDKALWH